jgi:3-hydroxyisobutyrate dehydrogenase-like beta-hydroxyacid dehydrogenase
VLNDLGEIRRAGEIGSAASLKLVANSMLAGVRALAAELMSAGTAADLNPEDVLWVLARIAPVLNASRPGLIEHRYEPVNFALHDALKDLRLGLRLYRQNGSETPLTNAVKELYERAAGSAGDLDMSAISTLYERRGTKTADRSN